MVTPLKRVCFEDSDFPFKYILEVFLLRSLRASPLMKIFFTPGGWDEVKCVYRKRLSRLELGTHIKNLV